MPSNDRRNEAGHVNRDPGQISPLFIVGSPRSGTTVVMRAIETLDKYYSPHVEGHFLAWLLKGVRDATANPKRHSQAFLPTSICTGHNFDKLLSWLAHAIDGFMREVAGVPGDYNANWIDKTPDMQQLRLLPLLQRIFPNCKIILTYRHPRDVVMSTRNVWDPKHSDVQLLRRWVNLHRQYRIDIKPRLGRKRVLEIQQETLVSHPDIVAESLGDFLDVSDTSKHTLADFFAKKRINCHGGPSRTAFTYLDQADPTFIKLVDLICGQEMAHWGYRSASQTGPLPPDDSTKMVQARNRVDRLTTLLSCSMRHPYILIEYVSHLLRSITLTLFEMNDFRRR